MGKKFFYNHTKSVAIILFFLLVIINDKIANSQTKPSAKRLDTIKSHTNSELKSLLKQFESNKVSDGELFKGSVDDAVMADIIDELDKRGVKGYNPPSQMKDREIKDELSGLDKNNPQNKDRIEELNTEKDARERNDFLEKIKDEGYIEDKKTYKYLCDIGNRPTQSGKFDIATSKSNTNDKSKMSAKVLLEKGTVLEKGAKYLQKNSETDAFKVPDKNEVSAANTVRYTNKNGQISKSCVGSQKLDFVANGVKGTK